ncbi:MAG: DUF1499 domain-containing protein [Rhizobiaceae bacterium]|nr:DUF1499 domain-containing protein [Rhizobiaceae bacterium]
MSVAAGRTKATGHYLRKRLRSPRWARRGAMFSGLLLVVSILVYRLGGIDFTALKAAFVVVLGLAGLSFLIALVALIRVWRGGHEGGGPAVGAVFAALLVAAPFAFIVYLAARSPQTNTAESDGMLAADIVAGASIGEALGANPAADAAFPLLRTPEPQSQVTSRRFQARAAQVYAVARTVLAAKGWELVAVDAGEPEASDQGDDLGISGTVDVPLPTPRSSIDLAAASDPFARADADAYMLQAVATSWILALPSEMTIRIVEDGTETFVDMRSTSRAVARDLGQNRRYVDGFLTALDEAMAGIAAIVPPGVDG